MGTAPQLRLAALLLLPPLSWPQSSWWQSLAPAGSVCRADDDECDVYFVHSHCDDPLSALPDTPLLAELCPVSCARCEITPQAQAFRNSCERSHQGCQSPRACAAAGPFTEDEQVYNRICLNNHHAAELRDSGLYYQPGFLHTGGTYHCSCCGAPLCAPLLHLAPANLPPPHPATTPLAQQLE